GQLVGGGDGQGAAGAVVEGGQQPAGAGGDLGVGAGDLAAQPPLGRLAGGQQLPAGPVALPLPPVAELPHQPVQPLLLVRGRRQPAEVGEQGRAVLADAGVAQDAAVGVAVVIGPGGAGEQEQETAEGRGREQGSQGVSHGAQSV